MTTDIRRGGRQAAPGSFLQLHSAPWFSGRNQLCHELLAGDCVAYSLADRTALNATPAPPPPAFSICADLVVQWSQTPGGVQ
jgi:hypothetical protein